MALYDFIIVGVDDSTRDQVMVKLLQSYSMVGDEANYKESTSYYLTPSKQIWQMSYNKLETIRSIRSWGIEGYTLISAKEYIERSNPDGTI